MHPPISAIFKNVLMYTGEADDFIKTQKGRITVYCYSTHSRSNSCLRSSWKCSGSTAATTLTHYYKLY